MGLPMMVVNLLLRALQLAFAAIVMALIGNIIAMSDHGNPSSTINYNLFVPAFTLLTLFWLVPAAIWERVAGHPAIVFIIDLLNTIFAFCGAIALPSKLHAPNCSNDEKTLHNTITRSSSSREKACREAQAATAFLWFLWFVFLISTIISGRQTHKAIRGTPTAGRRRPSRGHPQMAQV